MDEIAGVFRHGGGGIVPAVSLADAFAWGGHRVLSDNVSSLDPDPDGGAVLPSLRRIRMWGNAIDVTAEDRCPVFSTML